jgi:hypothetical protein
MSLQKPNLFIIGAPKCGTTAISSYLKTHPDIFIPHIKEPHFFADDFANFRTIENIETYLKLFENSGNKKYLCDASVWYLYSEKALNNIYKFNPQAKIIAILRNPIDMLPSLHQQLFYTLDEDEPNFKKAWNLQDQRQKNLYIPDKCREPLFLQYKDVVDYTSQLIRTFEYFPKQQTQILLFDDFKDNPGKVYKNILHFLGLDIDERDNFPKVNARKTFRIKFLSKVVHRPPKIFKVLANFAKKYLGIQKLELRKKIKFFNEKKISQTHLKSHFKKEIFQKLQPSIKELEKLLEVELENWRPYD